MASHEPGMCKERPSCGAVVLDRRAHRRWHAGLQASSDVPRPNVGLSDILLVADALDEEEG